MSTDTTGQGKRDFLKIILGGALSAWVGSVLYPIIAYLKPPRQPEVDVTSVKAGTLGDIPVGSGVIIRFGSKPVILIRPQGREVRAFEATCTHLDCTVQYRGDLGILWCACHNGKYDLNGRNIAGPPPRPLKEYRVVVQGEEISVSKNA